MITRMSRFVGSPRSAVLPLLLVSAGALSACSKLDRSGASAESDQASSQALSGKLAGMAGGAAAPVAMATSNAPSGADEHSGAADKPAQQRRVIRKADLSLESDSPDVAQATLTTLANAKGGFVVGADTTRSRSYDGSETVQTTIELRVPSTAFDATLTTIRSMPGRIASEKITGEDVTEEYVDLEARIRSRRALEEQYLTILKDAKTIPDTLAVEQKLGDVRTEIERAEGRRRFLENQTDLSTFTVRISKHIDAPPAPPEGPGFGRSIQAATHDTIDVTISIINGLIRLIGVLLPVGVMVVLPLWLIVRAWWRRRARKRQARANAAFSPPVPPASPTAPPPAPPPTSAID
jgi:hypothetical protein